MTDYAPGMRAVIRDEEWLIKRIETNSLGHQVLHCVGVTPLVKDRDAIFLTDLEQIQIVDPASIQLIADSSPFFKRSLSRTSRFPEQLFFGGSLFHTRFRMEFHR